MTQADMERLTQLSEELKEIADLMNGESEEPESAEISFTPSAPKEAKEEITEIVIYFRRYQEGKRRLNYHHRSGDSEGSAGNMLDRYAQSESAEEEYFEVEEEGAREVFARAFRLYLKKTLTGKERKFLKGILAGKETPAAIGKALGVKWFECLQEIQRKAFNNAEAFGRVVQLSGWSRAQEFSETVFKRLEMLRAGAELNEILPQNAKILRRRKRRREYFVAHREEILANRNTPEKKEAMRV